MIINSVNNLNFGKVIFKDDDTRQYFMKRMLTDVVKTKDKNHLYDKFFRIVQSDDTDITIEKTSGRYSDYILFSVTKNDKNVKSDFHYCQDTEENTQELSETFHELLDFVLFGKKKN